MANNTINSKSEKGTGCFSPVSMCSPDPCVAYPNEINWLKRIRLCKSFGLESEVVNLLGANELSMLNKEGLGI